MSKTINIDQLENLLANQEINLIDVREADEYASGHIPSAVNMPLSQLDDSFLSLDADKSYYLVCQMGGRSARAYQFLEAQGFDVTNVDGGTSAWSGPLAY
ncbi:rhodanese-like domain-containing protein [Streptococcus sp. HF-1907]|uniref:rhodanese-like domain-containing protein n=1 Tax=Streptococcus sp. HF-1907 TaxID=2785793 RepID=UPI00189E0E38|nr:rhodanese-like domain-containing protein [Streptococcus sp. HF-1907]MBF7093845.1 rhodanese-like domain-containing protein [Streptococcus sp. HF-1907]